MTLFRLLPAAWAIPLLLCSVAVRPCPAQQEDSAGGNAAILKQLSSLTGLAVLKPVNHITMKREQLKDYFDQRIKEVVKPEEIRLEELALKKMGFVPAEFDLKKTTVDLMAEQAAAFYDYRKKQMVMLDGGEGMMQELALVHELAHALADQHFQLEKYLKKAGANDDGAMARMAVMEGQATWLMSEFMAQRMGQSLKDSGAIVNMMSRMASAAGSGFPIFQSVPLYMRESLVFPYGQGMLFQHKVFEKLGKEAFAEVFRRPPQSSQEILHPELYLEKRAAAPKLKLPALENPKDWKLLADGAVGEFDHQILLKQYSPSLEALATQWRAARYQLWERKSDKRVALVYASQWANDKTAAEFLAAYKDVLAKKWTKCLFSKDSPTLLSGTSEDGAFTTRLQGAVVTSIEGL